MMGERFITKVERLKELTNLLLNHPEGLTKAQIARRLGVNRSTVPEDLEDLGDFEPVWEPIEGKVYAIRRENYRPKVTLSLNECLALHLAVRLLTTRTDKHYPQAASALRELAKAIGVLAPMIRDHMLLSASVLEDDKRLQRPIFLQNLMRLTKAWADGKKVRLTHEMEDGRIFDYVFCPYFIEPYAVGRTIHVIGLREPVNKPRTFKIERIHTVELLDETYEIPADFDPREELRNAWGIWYTEGEPVKVVLKFSPNVAKRVQETLWHHTQEFDPPEPDGSVIWRTWVDEWQEMLPWIRGWGAEVEVLEPHKLRIELMREAKRLANVYKVGKGDHQNTDLENYDQQRVAQLFVE
jgi:CRISPR-associated endonuclease/helicase Cas3